MTRPTGTILVSKPLSLLRLPARNTPVEMGTPGSDSDSEMRYLSDDEILEITEQFERVMLPGKQVMWSGVPREFVQKWADERGLQTLTTAMGPLMRNDHPSCRRKRKTLPEWSNYIKGASALFAEFTPRSNEVTVILRPPPHQFRLDGNTTYQRLEQPILKGQHGGPAVSRINVVHITVKGAEDHAYQMWPVDETNEWLRCSHIDHRGCTSRESAKSSTNATSTLSGDRGKSADCASNSCITESKSTKKKTREKKKTKYTAQNAKRRVQDPQRNPGQDLDNKATNTKKKSTKGKMNKRERTKVLP